MTRGEVFRIALPRTRSHEQSGVRYAVVVQADEMLGLSTILVAPTSRSARPQTFRPEIDLAGARTRVLVEQLRAVDISWLTDVAGRLTVAELDAVDRALDLVLGLR